MRSEIGKLAETIAELKFSHGSGHVRAAIVPINTHGQTLRCVETEIIQVLTRGRKACLSEEGMAFLLGADIADMTVTEWANKLSEQYQVTWSRRQRFGGLLFELVKTD